MHPLVFALLFLRPDPVIEDTVEGVPRYRLLPRDAIPAIRNPSFVSAAEARAFMRDEEPVMGLVLGGEVRAYPLWLLDGHEIVNDTVGKVPVAVTW